MKSSSDDEHQVKRRIVKLRRWISKRSPIGNWFARRDANPETASAESLLNALARARYGTPIHRAAGYYALRETHLTAAERNQASAIISRELSTPSIEESLFEVAFRSIVLLPCAYFVILAIFSATHYLSHPPYNDMDPKFESVYEIVFYGTLALICTFPEVIVRRRNRIVERAALIAASRHCGPQGIVVLHKRMRVHRRMRQLARPALIAAITAVNKSWYGRLPRGSMGVLITLAASNDEEFALAALDAIAAAGDGAVAVEVRRLTRTASTDRIQQRACEVLPILEDRKVREESQSVLLRASEDETGHRLVRPSGNTESSATGLLRVPEIGSRETDAVRLDSM